LKQIRNIPKPISISESIASSAVAAVRQVNAPLIICLTEHGGTARLVAKYRPNVPIVAATTVPKTARQLSMFFGVVPYLHTGTPELMALDTMRYAVESGLAKHGDIVIITSRQSVGYVDDSTTMMQIKSIPMSFE
jgi:pyruvate kinase